MQLVLPRSIEVHLIRVLDGALIPSSTSDPQQDSECEGRTED